MHSRWRCMRQELNHWLVSFVVLLLVRVVFRYKEKVSWRRPRRLSSLDAVARRTEKPSGRGRVGGVLPPPPLLAAVSRSPPLNFFTVMTVWQSGGYKEMSSIFADHWRPRIWAQMGGGGGGKCVVSANEYSCAHHVTSIPNKLWRSTSIFNLCWQWSLYSSDETALCGSVHGRVVKLVVGDLITCTAVGGAVHGWTLQQGGGGPDHVHCCRWSCTWLNFTTRWGWAWSRALV